MGRGHYKTVRVPSFTRHLHSKERSRKKCVYINHTILTIMMVVNNFCAVGTVKTDVISVVTVWTGVGLVGTVWTDVRTVTTEWTDLSISLSD